MPLPHAEVAANLQALLGRPGLFRDLTEIQITPPYSAPTAGDVLIGELQASSLTILAGATPDVLTIEPVSSDAGMKDFGIALPNGYYYVSHQDRPAGTKQFPVFAVQFAGSEARFLALSIEARIASESRDHFAAIVGGRGLLFYNNSDRPEPLFGVLSYEVDDSKSREILFIDLCVNLARNLLAHSKTELDNLAAAARDRTDAFQQMVSQLREKATSYYALENLRDFFNLLTYLRYLSATTYVTTLALGKRDAYTALVERIVPQMERDLAAAGHPMSLDELVELLDHKLQRLRQGTPLLGRLSWGTIHSRTTDQIADAVLGVVRDLKSDNGRAVRMLEDDMEDIRRMLTIVPPRIMSIPRIVGTVEKEQREAINGDAEYFWAVQRLKEQAGTFQLVLGLGSLVFSFFCPPVSIALGVFAAVVSVDQAVFKDALSDSDVSVDETLVTQAEARESAFWAGVDVVFSIVDVVGGISEARSALRTLDFADEASALPRSLDELATLGGDVTDARATARLTEAADADAIGRATGDVDLAAARRSAGDASTAPVDLSHSRRLADPPASAADAIEQATPAVRQSIDRRYVPLIDDAYARHFEELRARDLSPLSWDEFARDWQRIRLRELPVKAVPPPPREGFFRSLVGDGTLEHLLGRPADLREKLLARLEGRRVPRGLGSADAGFLGRLKSAAKRGASVEDLDRIINDEFLQPIRQAAAKAGAADDLEFGFFAFGVPKVSDWDDAAFAPLRRLFRDPEIDNSALHAIMRNRSYTKYLNTPRLNMDLAVALDRIKGIDGVMNRVSRTNPRLFDSLVAGNRGHAFEALLVSRILDDVEREGARIVMGRRWWLQEIDRLNVAEGTRYANVLEADVLLQLRDGRRILLDAKFFEDGLSITRSLDSQLAKIATGIDEGLIHNGEYWVSHHFAQSREGLTNLEAFRSAADLYSGGRIHIAFGVYESGFPERFLESSRFTRVSRGDAILIPSYPDLPVPGVTGPIPMPPDVVTPPPNALVPAAESTQILEPTVRQSDVIRTETTVSRTLRRSYVPINPFASLGRVVLSSAPIDASVTSTVRGFAFLQLPGGTDVGGQPARELAVGPLSAAQRDRLVQLMASSLTTFHLTSRLPVDGTPTDFYTFAVERAGGGAAEVAFQVVLYTEVGRLVEVLPGDSEWVEAADGFSILPVTARRSGDRFLWGLQPGRYVAGLRLRIDGRVVTYPQTLPLGVQRATGAAP